MRVTYSTKTSSATITLSHTEIRQFMSLQSVVEYVRVSIREAMKRACDGTDENVVVENYRPLPCFGDKLK